MPLRNIPGGGKAKAHVFLDVEMEEVVRPAAGHELRAGWGSKVVITIGPSCQDVATLVRLLRTGVTCARVDLSWGTKEYHQRSLRNLAEAMQQTRLLWSVWLDTTGREVVVRRPIEYDASGWPRQQDQRITVEKDQVFKITTDPTATASPSLLPVNYPAFHEIVEVGQQLQIGRYLSTGTEGMSLYADVVDVGEGEVTCVALSSAVLDGLLTVMVCHTEDEEFRGDFGLPLLTEFDVDCIKSLGSQFEVDFVNLSYCNSVDDLYSARALLDSLGMAQTKIIAKIERKAAIRNFEAIAHVADGIMISRGNLGLDFEPEVMALLQKRIVSRCNQLGKPVHITRIVDTMVSSPRPTRAEATDVANAVLDGVDGLLLGAETLRGEYPVETVETVLKLAAAAEKHFDYHTHHEMLMGEAYEEEVTMGRDSSVSDFRLYEGRSPDTALHRQRARSFGGGLSRLRGPTTAAAASGGGEDQSPGSAGTAQAGLSGPVAMQGIGNGPVAGAALAAISGRTPHQPQVPSGAANGAATTATTSFGADGGQYGGGGAVMPASPAKPYVSTFGSLPPSFAGSSPQLNRIMLTHAPYLSKLESIASSATRTAEKICAGLIIVMVQTGRTVSLVSKYRPPMAIMAVVVPTLKSNQLGWELEGKYLARQTLALRGVVPMLAAPMSDAAGSEDLLGEAIHSAFLQRLVKPHDYVVVITSHRRSMVVKVVQVNRAGTGLRSMDGGDGGVLTEAPEPAHGRSPFGASMPQPPSPHGALMSPSRTLSGRPSLVVQPSPPAFHLGAGVPAPARGGGGGGGYMMLSTPSEAQAYDDLSYTRVAAELAAGRPGRAARTGSPLSSGGTVAAPAGPFTASTGSPTSSGGSGRDPTSPLRGLGGPSSLSPITEQPSGPTPNGAAGGPAS